MSKKPHQGRTKVDQAIANACEARGLIGIKAGEGSSRACRAKFRDIHRKIGSSENIWALGLGEI